MLCNVKKQPYQIISALRDDYSVDGNYDLDLKWIVKLVIIVC